MSLDDAQITFGWPSKDEILNPQGIGAAIYAQQAQEKIGSAIGRRPDGAGVRVGVLASDPDATAAPLAIVCDFPKKVSDATLLEAQKLAWNFSRSLLLITVEPHIIRKWTCCEPPAMPASDDLFSLPAPTPEVGKAIYFSPVIDAIRSASEQATISLHWVDLLTGAFFQQYEDRFKPEKRADQLLLSNLKVLRQKLLALQLNEDICHDLLARVIFIQFLFDRKDTEGKAALSKEELLRLHEERILANVHSDFSGLLGDYEDTYALFRWLNSKFNGDLFPGKGAADEQDAAWEQEKSQVKPEHLNLLARFVSGNEQMSKGQMSLWPSYAFDAIPLDVISTIYEQFVKKDSVTGVHYTPSHVVDLMLDLVLPWEGHDWNLKVLDPSCGSGVFLVKAFQRLVYRWKQAHRGHLISGAVLTQFLEQNLFGVDLDAHAVRVASFSLYLAMCDEIDPRDYWKEVHFPIMRGRRLIATDFFNEECEGFRTSDGAMYDLVVGNPPWGKNTDTEASQEWASKHKWPVSYKDIGPLFLAKAIALTKSGGYVGLIQPSTILYKLASRAKSFREKLFQTAQVEEVVNFAALRSFLFQNATMPACAFIIRNSPPTGEAFWYSCPKPLRSQEDEYRIIIETQDIHQVFPDEVEKTPWLWSTLLWGGRRDLVFINNLKRFTSFADLEAKETLWVREGIIRGDQQKSASEILGKPLLEAQDLSGQQHLFIEADTLQKNTNPQVHSRNSTDFKAFELPQAIIQQSFIKKNGRFRAALVESTDQTGGILCSQSYLSLHTEEKDQLYLEAACLTYNSIIAVYYLLLTSGRFAMDRGEPEAEAFRSVPLPRLNAGLMSGLTTVEEVDQRVHEAFGIKEAEWLLVQDLAEYTLPDYRQGNSAPGRLATQRSASVNGSVQQEPELESYCNTFRRVLQAAYGKDKAVGAVIFSEPISTAKLPVRMISIYLNVSDRSTVEIEAMGAGVLQKRLTALYKAMLSTEDNKRSFYQRCARTYDSVQTSSGESGILINLIKPDQVRYWTRSMALRDADDVVADLFTWNMSSPNLDRKREVAFV